MDLNKYAARSGRVLKEDGSWVNEAEGINADGSRLVQLTGSNAQVYDGSVAWANSSAAFYSNLLTLPLPSDLQPNALYAITISNKSLISDITIFVGNKETFNSVVTYSELTRFGVVKNTAKTILVQGLYIGEGSILQISNDTVLNSTQGFTAYVRVRKV